MLQVMRIVNSMDSPDDGHGTETTPAVQRGSALVLEILTRAGVAVIMAGHTVIRIKGRRMNGTGTEVKSRVLMTIGSIRGQLGFRRFRSYLEHDMAQASGSIEAGNLTRLRQVVNIDAVRPGS